MFAGDPDGVDTLFIRGREEPILGDQTGLGVKFVPQRARLHIVKSYKNLAGFAWAERHRLSACIDFAGLCLAADMVSHLDQPRFLYLL